MKAVSPFFLVLLVAVESLVIGQSQAAPPPPPPDPVQVFVASTGKDSYSGKQRRRPKRTFQAAHDAVAPRGEIIVLDTAEYGPLKISQSVSITCSPGVTGLVTVTANAGVTIAAAPTDSVALNGLRFTGGAAGVQVTSVGRLEVLQCVFRSSTVGLFQNTSGTVAVRDSSFQDCDKGIQVISTSGLAPANVEHCRFDGCSFGIRAQDNARMVVRDSVACGRAATGGLGSYGGFVVLGGAGRDGVMFCDNCTSTNSGYGFASGPLATGGNGRMYLSNCTALGNDAGAAAFGSSSLSTYGNNRVVENLSSQFFSTGSVSPN